MITDYVASFRNDIIECEFISTHKCQMPIAHVFLRAQFPVAIIIMLVKLSHLKLPELIVDNFRNCFHLHDRHN